MSQIPSELVQSVCEVTGTTEAEAKHLLSACNNEVDAAVALFFEGGGTSQLASDDANLPLIGGDDDGVRAPIAPIREQLIGPEDDNFYAAAPPPRLRSTRRVKVCPLRDFAREGALMEEQLQQQEAGSYVALDNLYETATHSRSSSRRNRAADMVAAAQMAEPKKSRLEDLFRPPTDIAFAGSMQAARSRAEALHQWLLVNVQSDNFDSQLLNRDVWSDKALRKLMKRQFLLWQVDGDSSEGRRFVAFYHCAKIPYVCVIDPRTGEEMWKCPKPKQATVLLNELQQFLVEHKDFSQELADDCGPSTSNKRSATAICLDSDDDNDDGTNAKASKYNADADEGNSNASSVSSVKSGGKNPKKRNKIMELSEDEQIALAIRNSMKENGGAGKNRKKNGIIDEDDSDDEDNDDGEDAASELGSVEEFNEDDTKAACERTSYEEQLGANKSELTMLKLRVINAEGADEVVQLRWPSDTKVEVLHSYIRQCHSHIPKAGYKLICAFPRKTLESEHNACTLKEIGLHPSANLHITLDD
ncbi:UBX domain-containing protein 7 [Musca vetustissima]|uniref:UBX domain-containing protein 7 n=1 Tax=Musca vetustissima TaxID=27455 RepID=UPI002AB5EF2F|nr:UBX domain-containing protein 7 [Musca vetustissima]